MIEGERAEYLEADAPRSVVARIRRRNDTAILAEALVDATEPTDGAPELSEDMLAARRAGAPPPAGSAAPPSPPSPRCRPAGISSVWRIQTPAGRSSTC